ncbi:MAG: hypothetical protein L6302_00255, partial [Desulfobacteraceae bacterium]|nr:hypothetical protein [Desulfobacteraceae bacterium]
EILSVSSIEEIQSNPSASLDNGSMAIRLQSIEERLNKLSSQVDWQIENYEKRIDKYKDALIHKLEHMLDEERKQNKGLLLKYNLLIDRINKGKRLRAKG